MMITMTLGSGAENDLPVVEDLLVNLPDAVLLCEGESVELDPNLPSPNTWQGGYVQTTITATEPGIYSVSYDAMYPSSLDAVRVALNPIGLSLPVIANACIGETVSMAPDSILEGYSCQWEGRAETPVLETYATGVYSLVATNPNGCSIAGQITYTPFSSPARKLPEALQPCPDDSVAINALGDGSWLWSTHYTLSSIRVTERGVYGVSLTDSLGCTSTQSAMVSDESLPLHFLEAFVVCERKSDEVEVLSPNGGVLWIDPPVDNPAALGEGLWQIQASNLCVTTTATAEVARERMHLRCCNSQYIYPQR
jgi:hypothetical protein